MQTADYTVISLYNILKVAGTYYLISLFKEVNKLSYIIYVRSFRNIFMRFCVNDEFPVKEVRISENIFLVFSYIHIAPFRNYTGQSDFLTVDEISDTFKKIIIFQNRIDKYFTVQIHKSLCFLQNKYIYTQ